MTKNRADIPLETIRKVLGYDPDTGVFTRLSDGRKVGFIVGGGYEEVFVAGKRYKAHRVAYAFTFGECPAHFDVDHIDGCRNNNRASNLRLATRSENCQNQKTAHKDSKSGMRGVYLHKKTGKYAAQIMLNNQNKHLGLFSDKWAAFAARIKAERELHAFSPLNDLTAIPLS